MPLALVALGGGCLDEPNLYVVDARVDVAADRSKPNDLGADAAADITDAAVDVTDATADVAVVLDATADVSDVEAPVDIPLVGPLAPCLLRMEGVGRECGWSVGRVYACAPGSVLTVGCDQYCTPPVGSCLGDTAIRVCGGVGACSAAEALASGDDNGCLLPPKTIDPCARATLSCPSSGRVTVLVGSSATDTVSTCNLGMVGGT